MEKEVLINAAEKFRQAFNTAVCNEDFDSRDPITKGNKRNSSDIAKLFANYIIASGIKSNGGFDVVKACYGYNRHFIKLKHSWIEIDGLIVDVTCSEAVRMVHPSLAEYESEIYVGEPDKFHSSLKELNRSKGLLLTIPREMEYVRLTYLYEKIAKYL